MRHGEDEGKQTTGTLESVESESRWMGPRRGSKSTSSAGSVDEFRSSGRSDAPEAPLRAPDQSGVMAEHRRARTSRNEVFDTCRKCVEVEPENSGDSEWNSSSWKCPDVTGT
jgi:hypothetical protein